MRTIRHTAVMTAVLLLAACQSTTVQTESRITLPAAFSQAQAVGEIQNLARWWQNWRDPVLSTLIEQGLANGYDIQIAQSRLAEARAQANLARADLGPTVGASGKATHSRSSMDNPLPERARAALSGLPGGGRLGEEHLNSHGNMFTGALSASWEADIFGRKRSDADAAKAAALGVQEQYYGAQMLLAADIAEHYFQARAMQAQQRATAHSIAALERLARYVDGRFRAGHVTAYEKGEVQSRLSAMRGKQSTERAQEERHIRAIAVLIGQPPQTFRLADSTADVLAHPPAAPQGETPQSMIERRPDLRARAAQIQARAAQVASAKADLLPRFSINFLGQGGRIELSGDESLKGWSNLFSVGISVPLFTNGRIRANIAAADARLQTALLEYDRALLQALADTDNAYQFQAALARQNALLQAAQRQTAKQAEDAQKLFRYGNKTLDNALTAQIADAQAQEQLTQSRLARAQALVGLYKALGGGWTEQ